jgi:hypothetical protein
MTKILTAIAAALTLGATTLTAGVTFDGSPGTGAPPATLGGYTMTSFDDDTRGIPGTVSDVTGPTGDVGFSPDLTHVEVGSGWATWSHGYTGDVYYSTGTTITMTLPANTVAFQFYSEPNSFSTFTMEAITDDGTSSGEIEVTGHGGAQYFGFYADGGDKIASVTITVPSEALGLAVGDFAIAACSAPEISVSVSPSLLLTPNHQMADITATVDVSGGCGDVTVALVSVTSDEADNGPDDGNTVNDIDGVTAGTEDYNFRVRAERCGSCDGRVYTVRYSATDGDGNVSYGTATISVPVGRGGLD